MSKTAIAVFVKTIKLSPVKTRLAKDIGTEKATALYRLCLKATEETVLQTGATMVWAVAEEDAQDHPDWQNHRRLWTGEGCLGARQSHIYNSLLSEFETVVLIGSDCPQMSTAYIKNAIEKTDRETVCIGPARDGGYTLFSGQAPIDESVWTSVEYSRPDTRESLISKLPLSVTLLPLLTDIDTIDDLEYVRKEMPPEGHRTKYQDLIIAQIKKRS